MAMSIKIDNFEDQLNLFINDCEKLSEDDYIKHKNKAEICIKKFCAKIKSKKPSLKITISFVLCYYETLITKNGDTSQLLLKGIDKLTNILTQIFDQTENIESKSLSSFDFESSKKFLVENLKATRNLSLLYEKYKLNDLNAIISLLKKRDLDETISSYKNINPRKMFLKKYITNADSNLKYALNDLNKINECLVDFIKDLLGFHKEYFSIFKIEKSPEILKPLKIGEKI
jgi:hypothetical protein